MMTVKTRIIEDYLALPYTIEIVPDDAAWFVQIKELSGCMTEVDKPTTLEYTWRQHSWSPDWKDSRVRWQLSPSGDGTHVQLHHWDFPNAEERDSHDEGWDLYFLGPMAEYLEDNE